MRAGGSETRAETSADRAGNQECERYKTSEESLGEGWGAGGERTAETDRKHGGAGTGRRRSIIL